MTLLDVARPVAVLAGTMLLINQMRRPSRWLGQLFLKDMNRRHSAVTDWGLSHAQIGAELAVADIGCGGGRTIEKLAALAPRAHIVGIDYAAGSVAESRAHNTSLIADGRVEVIRASVTQLPGPAAQFDLATAVETHYYWPNLVDSFKEVRRVLRPGGTLVLIAETYREGRLGWLTKVAMAPLRAAILTAEEHRRLLAAAGFDAIEIDTDPQRGWICAVARVPVGS